MAANYTASTITIFLNIVGSYFLRLYSFLIQKKYTTSKNATSMLHVVPGDAKNMIIQKQHINYEEIAQKYHVFSSL